MTMESIPAAKSPKIHIGLSWNPPAKSLDSHEEDSNDIKSKFTTAVLMFDSKGFVVDCT